MKRPIYLIVFLFLSISLSGQQTAEEFLAAVPKLTFNPCHATWEQESEFKNEISRYDSLIRAKIENLSQESEQFQNAHEDEQIINVLLKQGYSREDAEKLKNADQMSDEELMEMANSMMLSKYNMDTNDIKQLDDMDTAAQRRWANAQSTISMAETEAEPEKYQSEQLTIKSNFELQNELKFQKDKLRAGEDKYLQKLDALYKAADTARSMLKKQLESYRNELENCQNDLQRDQIKARMTKLKEDYCLAFTPAYLEIVEQYKAYIGQNLKEYYTLEKLQIKSVEAETGVKNPNYKPGSVPMGIVESYINLVAGSFRFYLNSSRGIPIID